VSEQNRSTAVMQRRVEAHDSLDDFPTPPWATRGILNWLAARDYLGATDVVREPCANRGHMVLPLCEVFDEVLASDILDYGAGFAVSDYLFGLPPAPVDWTFMNPPFRLAEQFIERALGTSCGVAVIVRSAFLEGVGRYESLWSKSPPQWVVQHVERVPMVKGRYDPKASSATAYCWLIWLPRSVSLSRLTQYAWLPPCRKRFERKTDAMIGTRTLLQSNSLEDTP
jgi:hypothetical protein